MKLIRNIAIAACLLISVSVNAQQHKKMATKVKHLPPPPPAPKVENPNADFLARNKEVKAVKWEPNAVLVLEKADGTIEKYEVDKFYQEEKVKSLYGNLPHMPAPVKDHSAPTSYNPNKPNN